MKVKQAAIIDDTGKIYTLPKPARHHHIIRHMYQIGLMNVTQAQQGFVLEDGTFVNRIEAAKIALENKQTEEIKHSPNLYSEDLW